MSKKNSGQKKEPKKMDQAQTQGNQQARSANTVVVALNRPTGINFSMPDGRKVLINGNAADLRGEEKGVLPVGAFGLTTIDRDDWEYIKKTYGRMEIFENGLIFASERKADAMDEAEEKAELRHGLEPINPETANTSPNDGKE